MKSMLRIIFCIILVAPHAPAQAGENVTLQFVNDWMTTYYAEKNPARSHQVLNLLNEGEFFSMSGSMEPAIGFFSQFFRMEPTLSKAWLEKAQIKEDQGRSIVKALMLGGMDNIAKDMVGRHGWNNVAAELVTYPTDIHALKINPGAIDLWWGAFFATGDPIFLQHIWQGLELTNEDIKFAAKWSLGINAEYHPLVKQAMESGIKTTDSTEIAKELRAVLAEVEENIKKIEAGER